MTDLSAALRAAREAAGISLALMATRTHYSKPLWLGQAPEAGTTEERAKLWRR